MYNINDKKRKAIIKQGMILLGGALTAKTSSGLGSIFAVKDDVDIRKGIDSVQFTLEQIVNSLEDIIVIKSKR